MSYTVSVTRSVCPTCGERAPGYNWDGCTYNLAPMFKEAGFSMHELNGLSGQAAAEILSPAVRLMQSDPARFIKLNPPNGWGDYHGVMPLLLELLEACVQWPDAAVHVS